MSIENFDEIKNIVDKLKRTSSFQQYQQAYNELMQTPSALGLIDEYNNLKIAYADKALNNEIYGGEREKKDLLLKKKKLSENPYIRNYYASKRVIDFFIDDLNYDINQLVGKTRKKHSHIKG